MILQSGAATFSKCFVNCYFESSTGRQAILQLPCCPNKQASLCSSNKTRHKTVGTTRCLNCPRVRCRKCPVILVHIVHYTFSVSYFRREIDGCHGKLSFLELIGTWHPNHCNWILDFPELERISIRWIHRSHRCRFQ